MDRDGTTFNYGASNYFQRPDERHTAGLFAHYDLLDNVEACTELMFMNNRSVAQIAPSGSFFSTDTLSCGHPFLSGQQLDALCGKYGLTESGDQTVYIGRRNVEGGNRQNELSHTVYRGVFGLRGDLTDHWRYNLHYQYSKVNMQDTYLNDLSVTKIERALDAVQDPVTGQAVCRSVLDGSAPDCVPWNIFREGAVNQEMVDYLTLPLAAQGSTSQTGVSGHIAGNLGTYGIISPFAEDGPDVVVGGEYRSDYLEYNPDDAYSSGDGAGQSGPSKPVSGGIDVSKAFLEVGVPLIEHAPFAEEVGLDGGYRYSDYDYGPQTHTFGLRTGWTINFDIRLRASFQRAIRAPNVRERFGPRGLSLFEMSADPCGGPLTDGKTEQGRTLEECARSGVTAAQFGDISHSTSKQYYYLQGGNPNLIPEKIGHLHLRAGLDTQLYRRIDSELGLLFDQDQEGH